MANTTNLDITKPAVGQAQPQATIATGFDLFDTAIAGRLSKSVAGNSNVTLTTAEGRNAILEFTGALTGNINVIVPTKTKIYAIYNSTSGAYTLTVKTSGGTGIAVAQGSRAFLYCDGTNVVSLSSPLTVEESDGAPSVAGVTKIKVSNGSLTDDGSGVVTISTGGGGGITVEEADGSPTVASVTKIKVSNGTLTDNGSGVVTVTTGGGGSGDVTEQGVYGSRPAADNDGDLYFATDGLILSRDKGSGNGYSHWGPLYALEPPPASSGFTWVNQGGATVSDTKGGILMKAPSGTGSSLRVLKKAAPSTPYTITVAFLQNNLGVDYLRGGLCFRQSSDGKLVYAAVGFSGTFSIYGFKFNDATTYSGGFYFDYRLVPHGLYWLRIGDDGSNRTIAISADGNDWLTVHTVGRTDFLTADEIGLVVDANNANFGSSIFFVHYKEA